MSEPSTNEPNIRWTYVIVRWVFFLLLFSLSYLASPDLVPRDDLYMIGILALTYNIAIAALAVAGIRFRFLPLVANVVDILFAAALAAISGWRASPAYLFPLIPVMIAAMRYRWIGGLLTGVVVGAFWTLPLFLQEYDAFPWAVLLSQYGLLVATVVITTLLVQFEHRHAVLREKDAEEQRKLAGEQVQAIYDLTGTLTAALDQEQVLESILDVAFRGLREISQADKSLVGLVLLFGEDSERDRLKIAAARSLSAPEEVDFGGEEGVLAEVLDTIEPQLLEHPDRDPELGALPGLQGYRWAMVLPMRAGFDLFGIMIFATRHKNTFGLEQRAFLRTLCNQATIALQNARFCEQLEAEKNRLIDDEEQLRHWLARELHDGPTQTMSAVAMRLNYVKALLEKDPSQADLELSALEQMARRATREIRTVLFKLRPLALESEGLRTALEQYAKRLEEEGGPELAIDIEPPPEALDEKTESTLFAILEEAINNARKHAEADKVTVRVVPYENAYVATVRDNGKGFDVEAMMRHYDKRGSLGLVNMRERAELFGGKLEIESRPGYGTIVTVMIPL
jgi:signal transduction histidine kinase